MGRNHEQVQRKEYNEYNKLRQDWEKLTKKEGKEVIKSQDDDNWQADTRKNKTKKEAQTNTGRRKG